MSNESSELSFDPQPGLIIGPELLYGVLLLTSESLVGIEMVC